VGIEGSGTQGKDGQWQVGLKLVGESAQKGKNTRRDRGKKRARIPTSGRLATGVCALSLMDDSTKAGHQDKSVNARWWH
jgi:hypothetical protein